MDNATPRRDRSAAGWRGTRLGEPEPSAGQDGDYLNPGGRRYFEEMGVLVKNAPGGKPDLEQLRELNRRYDFVLVPD